jgi:uncharacterized protein
MTAAPTPTPPSMPPPHDVVPATQTGPSLPPWSPQRSAPVGEGDRIDSIDVLRGVALLGILILNIQAFAMPGAAYMNPYAYGDLTGANYWVWWLSQVFADQKFMTIFSMLFGAGIVVMTSRAEQRAGHSAAIHYRRMGWLILFGLLHAHLLWYGDILYAYGMCGLAAWLFRRLPPAVLIPLGAAVIAVGSGISLLMGWGMQLGGEEAVAGFRESWQPSAEAMAGEIEAYRGSWLGQMWQRMPSSMFFQTFLFATWSAWRAGGLMLVGMGLFKLGVFSARRSRSFYVMVALLGLGIGVPLTMYGLRWVDAHRAQPHVAFFFGSQFNYWASPLISMAYVSLIMLVCKSAALRDLTRPFAAVGRMALTNYLMQTIICTTIFYGHGLGLFGSVERTGQIAIVAGVWIAQLIYSPIWLRYFEFGPFEWLWRGLTYWKVQPFRRSASLE